MSRTSSEDAEVDGSKISACLNKIEIIGQFRRGDLSLSDILKRISDASLDDELLQVKPNGSTVLNYFTLLGVYDVVKALLQKGLKPTILQCRGGVTVLQCAVRFIPVSPGDSGDSGDKRDLERSKILQLYLSSKEEYGNSLPIDNQDALGWTALKLAACLNLEKCVEVLLQNGADAKLVDGKGYSPLHSAVGYPSIVKMLLHADPGNVNQQNEEGDTPLSLALKRGDLESTLVLLEHGADTNIPNKEGITPLFLAAKMGRLELVKTLFKHGSSVNAEGGEQDITPLHWAAHMEVEEVALYLIENGADVMARDKEGRTPLSMATPELAGKMRDAAQKCQPSLCTLTSSKCRMTAQQKAVEACCSGNIQMLCTLLHAGSLDINHTSGSTGASLLHTAAYYGQLPVIVYLFHHGANIRAVDKDGDSVLHFACMKNFKHGRHIETVRFLSHCLLPYPNEQNQAGDTPLMVALRHCFPCRAKCLLFVKADTKIANSSGELPLHRAAQDIRNIELLFILVEMCEHFDPRDLQGATPLMYAVRANCSPAAKYLLQRGVEPNVQDHQGNTPLLVAAQELYFGICLLLLVSGADPNVACTERKITPLHVAVRRNSGPICKILLTHGADLLALDADGHTPLSLANPVMRKALTLLMGVQKEVSSQLQAGGSDEPGGCTMPCNEIFSDNDCVASCDGGVTLCDYDQSTLLPPCHTSCPTTLATPLPEGSGCNRSPESGQRLSEQGQRSSEHCLESVTNGVAAKGQGSVCDHNVTEEVVGDVTVQGQRSSVTVEGQRSVTDDVITVEGRRSDATVDGGSSEVVVEKKMERKDTFSKEQERGEVEGDPVSQERYQELQSELASLTDTACALRRQVETLTGANRLLIAKNHSLTNQMKRNQNMLVSRHVDQALSLTMHALCSGLIYSENSIHCSESASPHEVHTDSVPANFLQEAIDKEPGWSPRETAQAEEVGGPAATKRSPMHPNYNPLNSGHLQWWMVDDSTVEIEPTSLNASSAPGENFFDVHRGTFRQMEVAVRVVLNVKKWSYEQYMTFFQEVNCLSCLHCPHIVQFLGACFDPASKVCYLVNEYMSRGSFHSVLHEEKLALEWGTRVSIMLGVSRGLAFLHSHHMIHRHLMPKNILIGEHLNAKLNDYGLQETKVKSGFFENCKTKCCPLYIAPEAMQKFEFTQASDVYSMGMVMYECATSKKVFSDLSCTNPMTLVMRMMMGARPSFPEGVATNYRSLAEKCWTADPDFRPTAESVAMEVSQIAATV